MGAAEQIQTNPISGEDAVSRSLNEFFQELDPDHKEPVVGLRLHLIRPDSIPRMGRTPSAAPMEAPAVLTRPPRARCTSTSPPSARSSRTPRPRRARRNTGRHAGRADLVAAADEAYRQFTGEHYAARIDFRDGRRDAVFPAGTVFWREIVGVNVAPQRRAEQA